MTFVGRSTASALTLLAMLGACGGGPESSYQDLSAVIDGERIDQARVDDLRSRLKPEDPLLLMAMHSLTWKYYAEGRLVEARRSQEDLLQLMLRLSETTKADYKLYWMARNLGILLLLQGDPGEALRFSELSMEFCRRSFPQPRGHPELAVAWWLRGMIVTRLGRNKDAEQSLRRAAEIFTSNEDQYPDGNERYAECLLSLGALLGGQGREEEAVVEFGRAERELVKATAGSRPASEETRILSASIKTCLGQVLLRLGRSREAVEKLTEARRDLRGLEAPALARSALIPAIGARTTDRSIVEQALGAACFLAGDPVRSVEHLREALRAEAVQGAKVLSRAGEAEAANYAETFLQTWRLLYSPWVAAGLDARVLHRQLASRKAVLFRFLNARKRGADLSALQRRYVDLSSRLSGAMLVSGSVESKDGTQRRMRELQREKEAVERDLASREPVLASLLDPDASQGEAAETLPARTAFVDFYAVWEYHPRPGMRPEGKGRYVAFVVSGGRTTRVDLGPVQVLNEAVDAWRRSFQHGKPGDARPQAAELGKALWEPLTKGFEEGVRRVVLCPDGMLALVPWGALNEADGLVAEKYCLSTVTHPSELSARNGIDAPGGEGEGRFQCVGDVSFDSAPDPPPVPQPGAARRLAPKFPWDQLRRSKIEIDEVAALARSAGKRVDEPLERERASTTRVADRLPSARWIHLSTHGFVADAEHRRNASLVDWAFDRGADAASGYRTTAAERNPLAIVGLVMAGANRPRAADETGVPLDDGGILSGAAIAALDLRRTSLVVLSACDTARGFQSYGEGFFGLARAFQVAGARQVVATLWQVDEERTLELLRLFYANYFRMPAAQALQQAQLEMDRRLRADGTLPRDPAYYWAGLYLSGS